MDPRAFLASLERDESLVHLRELPARTTEPGPFPEDVPEILVDRLGLIGITGLYEHQRTALDLVRSGRNVIVATGTASGKTLVYNLAFASEAVGDPKRTALYLFPTKALARDQLRQIRELKLPQLRAAVYDGDTPRPERPLVRKNANLVLSNPDMLHASILPDHARWADFLLRLSLVVVDEAHVARGVFGSHVAHVLRRLRRLVAHYGGDPRFVLASATVGNPVELGRALVGVPFDAVTEDRSPGGERLFALLNPPVIDEESGARRSALTEASQLIARMAEEGVKSIGFTRSRRAAELLAEFARRELDPELKRRVKAYRAGYLAEDRRELERQLANDELIAVASTNALELGIDIGSLDAAVLVGYPGTRASMWQQAGRAGRRAEGSLAVLVAQDEPLDQYLVTHPEDLFDKPPEAAVIDPTNPFVLEPHLACAAREHPLSVDEAATFWPGSEDALERLEERGELARRRDRWHHRGREAPHRGVNLRSAGGHTFSIVIEETGELLGTVDESRAYSQVHPGAIYLHQGEQFEVRELDLTGWAALVARSDPDYYTQARDTTDIAVERVDCRGPLERRRPRLLRLRPRHRPGRGVRAQARGDRRDPRRRPARASATDARDQGRLVVDPSRDDRPGRDQGERAARVRPRRRARRDRPAPLGRDVRPVGRRRRLDRLPSRHGLLRDLRLRRLSRRGRDRPARVHRCRSLAGGDPRDRPELSLLDRLPLVRAVSEVRQRQRAARQARRGSLARRDVGKDVGMKEPYVAVVGPSAGTPTELALGEAVGRGLAEAGAVLVCGGMGGVMEAAAGGAMKAGGKTVGVLPTSSRLEGNPYLTIAVATGMGEARNAIVVRTADVVIAVHGEFGTLSEIALALKMGKPVVGLGTWELRKAGEAVNDIVRATSAEDAVAKALQLLPR